MTKTIQDLFDRNDVSFALALAVIAVNQIHEEIGEGATTEQVRKRVEGLLGALANYKMNKTLLQSVISSN